MAMNSGGSTFTLSDDCDTLYCKLDNAAFEAEMEGNYEAADQYAADRDGLEVAIAHRNHEQMQAMLDKYHTMFKRYS